MKVILIILILIAPVGFILAINEPQVETQKNNELLSVKKTTDIQTEPIEIVSMRTATSKTYDNGDGSYKAVIHLAPINYQENDGNWQEIEDSKTTSTVSTITNLNTRSGTREVYTLTPTADCFICGGPGGDDWNMGADQDLYQVLDGSSIWKIFRPLLRFDLSGIPWDSEIDSGELQLQYYFSGDGVDGLGSLIEGGATASMTITANIITKSWIEGTGTWDGTQNDDGATWNTHDGSISWSSAGGDFLSTPTGMGSTPTSGYGVTKINVKSIVEKWLSGTDNYGVILRGTGGDDSVKMFRSKEYGTPSQRPKLVIEYISNHPPFINTPYSSLELVEDQPEIYLDLDGNTNPQSGLFRDPDFGDRLSFNVWTGTIWAGKTESDLMAVTIIPNCTLEFDLENNAFGNETITVKATDNEGASIQYEITINVEPMNDPPKINDTIYWKYDIPEPNIIPGRVSCLEDQWVNFTITAFDPIECSDDKNLTYHSNNTNYYAKFFNINSSTGRVSFKATNSDVGSYYLKIIVNDHNLLNNLCEFSFILDIINGNDKPMFKELEVFDQRFDIPAGTSYKLPVNASQGEAFNFIVFAEDEDFDLKDSDEQIRFRINPEDKFILTTYEIYPERIYINFIPTNDDVGTVQANLTVTDLDGKRSTILLEIDVENKNDPPKFVRFYYKTMERKIKSEIFDLEKQGHSYDATEYNSYEFKIEAIDIDVDDELKFIVKIEDRTDPESNKMYTIDDINGKPNIKKITIVPDTNAGREGKLWINVTVSDLLEEMSWIRIKISVINTNDPPEQPIIVVKSEDGVRKVSKVENLIATFSVHYSNEIIYKDPDGNNESELLYTWDFGDDTDPEDGLEVKHLFPKEGIYTLTLTITDPKGTTNVTTIELDVLKPDSANIGDSGEEEKVLGLGSVAGFPIAYIIIIIIVIVIILVVAIMMYMKKKRAEQEFLHRTVTIRPQILSKTVYSPSGQILRFPIIPQVPVKTTSPVGVGILRWIMQSVAPAQKPVQRSEPQTQQIKIRTQQLSIPTLMPQLPPAKTQAQKQTEIQTQAETQITELETGENATTITLAPTTISPNHQPNTQNKKTR